LAELNRWAKETPGQVKNEYVQWQRGPLSQTPMDLMKSWVDTVAALDNAWLVLVFHGVEGVGWEARSKEDLREYYEHIAAKRDHLWVAPFREVTQYMRERMSATIEKRTEGDAIYVKITHTLDPKWYTHPLTLKTAVPSDWSKAKVTQGSQVVEVETVQESGSSYVMYEAMPNSGEVAITELK
jgi:hypothetical protein